MKVKELHEALSAYMPLSLRQEWDNDGIMCSPDLEAPVRRVLCVLDVTGEVVDYAVKEGFDVILSHHPLIFHPVKAVTPADFVTDKALRLLSAGISVLSFHTRADAAVGGVNDCLAEALGLTDIAPLPDATGEELLLRVGNLPLPLSPATFAACVKERLGSPTVLYAGAGGEIRRVAVCGGDGKDLVAAARKAGADAYVSGRISYNLMEDAPDSGMCLVEAGHYSTENPVTYRFAEWVREVAPETEVACRESLAIRQV